MPAGTVFRLARALWLGVNAATFVVAAWYATLPAVEGTHPGFLLAPIWIVFLFPGVIAMVIAFALLNAVVPAWVLERAGPAIFFSVWLAGGGLTYAFWFVWVPRGLASLGRRRDRDDKV
jgi:hypothetical protein